MSDVQALLDHLDEVDARQYLRGLVAGALREAEARGRAEEQKELLAFCNATPVREWAKPYMDQLIARIRARGAGK